MSILAQLKINKRIFVVGAVSLIGLLLVTAFAMMELRASLTHSFEARTQQTLDVAYSQLERYQAEEKAGRMSREQAQAAAIQAVESLRFGELNYFFMFDHDMKMVAHPVKPELIGQNLDRKTDAGGKLHFRAMREAGEAGGGFVQYGYQMPDGSGVKQKLSYARGFQPWGWIIATGVFNEEIDAAVHNAMVELAKTIAAVLVILLAVIWGISRSITLPLGAITARMRSLAAGNVSDAIPGVSRRDELGEMAGALQVFRDQAIAKADAEAAKAEADADQKMIVSLVSNKLEKLSEGDLTSTIEEDVPSAYAALKSNFNTAIANLSELIGALADASHSIETGSSEIAAASDDLARRTESNAASLEETSSALAQMNDRLKSSAEAAERTVNFAQGAIGMVDNGRSTADKATSAMDRVGESARGIDDVIEGVDKIAFQTRVLAMNAAVEAGRAGEAGRGFAVVADLVSALAMRAEEEAKRAREQLTATQADIVIAVDAVQDVDTSLANITDSVREVHQFVESMANDNREQSLTISEIATAMTSMDEATQQNAAMVEQTSAAARNLASEVISLASQSARFTVADKGGRPKAPVGAKAVSVRAVMPAARSVASTYSTRSNAVSAASDWTSF